VLKLDRQAAAAGFQSSHTLAKINRRRWCSMRWCGNRMKVAAFYQRRRAKT